MNQLKTEGDLSNLALVLVSGGMDSCLTAAIAQKGNGEIALLHVSYGQRTEKRERKAFEDIADFYNIEKRLAVSIEYLAKIGGSSLTDKNIEVAEANLESKEIRFATPICWRLRQVGRKFCGQMQFTSARSAKIRAVIPIVAPNFTRRLKKQSKPAQNLKQI
jgi:hypothetical protein